MSNQPVTPETPDAKEKRIKREILQTYATAATGLTVAGLATGNPALLLGGGGLAAGYFGVKVAVPTAETAFWQLMDIGNPEGTGAGARFLNFLIKRGEGDMPKEWKMALDIYDKTAKAATVPFQVVGGAASIAFMVLGQLVEARKKSIADGKVAKAKTEEEKAKKLAEAIEANTANIENERLFQEFLARNDVGFDLLPGQQAVFNDIWDDGGDPVKARQMRRNLFGWLNIDLGNPDALTQENITAQVAQREIFNNFYRAIPATTTPAEAARQLTELRADIQNGKTPLKGADGKDIPPTDNVHRAFVEELNRMIERLGHPGANWADILQEVQDVVTLTNTMNAHADREAMFDQYREAWLAGAGYSMIGTGYTNANMGSMRAEVQKQFQDLGLGAQNPMSLFGFMTVPDAADVATEKTRLRSIETTVLPQITETTIGAKVNVLHSLPQAEQARVMYLMSELTPNEAVLIDSAAEFAIKLDAAGAPPVNLAPELSLSPLTDAAVIDMLKKLFQRTYSTAPSLFAEDIDLVLEDLRLNHAGAYAPDLEAYLVDLQKFAEQKVFMSDGYFGNGEAASNKSSVLNTVKNINGTGPKEVDFLIFYEGFGGEFDYLERDVRDVANGMKALYDRKLAVIDDFEAVVTNPDKRKALSKAHTDYLLDVFNGNATVESNLRRGGRDHAQYLNEIQEFLDRLGRDDRRPPLDFDTLVLRSSVFGNPIVDPTKVEAPDARGVDRLEAGRFQADSEELVEQLSAIFEGIYDRLGTISGLDASALTPEIQREYNFLARMLGILKVLGANEDGFNLKPLRLYLNGYNLSIAAGKGSDLTKAVTPLSNPLGVHNRTTKIAIP